MREAEVTCLIRMTRIPDLNLELVKDQVVLVPEDQAQGSKDLALFKSMNAVKVRWVRRFHKLREADQPFTVSTPKRDTRAVRPLHPQQAPLASPVDAPEPPAAPNPQLGRQNVDLELLATRLEARLGGAIDRVVAAIRESRPVVVSADPSAPGKPGKVGDEVPTFIPDKILDPDAAKKVDIRATETTGEAGGIDAAKAALKKARGGRKQKERWCKPR